MATRARDRLLAAAQRLFYAEGIRAVGLERLLEDSGVGRASFYRHFASKDELVAAMLDDYDREYRAWLSGRVEALGGEPLALFDALAERSKLMNHRGCAFVNVMAEVGDPESEVYRLAAAHKSKVVDYAQQLLADAGYTEHARLAEQLVLLMDGATATALRERSSASAQRAKAIAEALLATADRTTPNPGRRREVTSAVSS